MNDYYKDIEIAITPDEVNLVPKYIKKIINIGYREIGYDTIIKIMPGNVRELESAASYYKTLDAFPEYIINKNNKKAETDTLNYSIIEILKVINENTDSFHGIGRTSLIYELKEKNIIMSDSKVRMLLELLNKKWLIEIRKGRSGNRITQHGTEYLNKYR